MKNKRGFYVDAKDIFASFKDYKVEGDYVYASVETTSAINAKHRLEVLYK